DINVGVISSSLGDMTSGFCTAATNPNDGGRLVVRGVPLAETYKGLGYLAWDPDGTRGGDDDIVHLTDQLGQLVLGVEQQGCGYEMPLESILRFLVDPEPYATIGKMGAELTLEGTDSELRDQRESFLRPDSLVAVLILSDENDCSFDPAKGPHKLLKGGADGNNTGYWKGTSECASNPADECCQSCEAPDAGCDAGGACAPPAYGDSEDLAGSNLKCWQQKQRYGEDFLYPVRRYVNAFTQERIDPTQDDYGVVDPASAIDNPLFIDKQGVRRGTDRVVVAGIVGVPWQAIAQDPSDLSQGFKEYVDVVPLLPALVGDPDKYVYPEDPFMRESTDQRSGTSALLDAAPDSTNVINGHDYTPVAQPSSLQFSCIFPLPVPLETTDPDADDCNRCDPADAAFDPACDNPLCNGGQQINAKSVPSLRELSLLAGLGEQAVFASICAETTTGDSTAPNFGYNPAVNTIIERLQEKLRGSCLARQLQPDDEGLVQCLVIEAQVSDSCECDADSGRAPIEPTVDGKPNPTYNAVEIAKNDAFADPAWNCFCEIQQLTAGAERDACLTVLDPQADSQGDGWCYIDAASAPPVGNPELVAGCPATERRLLRFVGKGEPRPSAIAFITCSGG
ncbi:MAG: hypothetical protein JNK04_04470, partial [Myxococcales bacterium]|nr:hypothetical protein [Myxococcales bacterium]